MSSSPHPFSPPASDLCRVLWVDDDPVMQRIYVRALVLGGFAIECVCNALEVLQRFQSDARGFDVLVTDQLMPGLNGDELVAVLRTHGFTGTVLVVSGALTPSVVRSYRAHGVDAFLEKPIDLDALRTAVVAAADAPFTPRALHSQSCTLNQL